MVKHFFFFKNLFTYEEEHDKHLVSFQNTTHLNENLFNEMHMTPKTFLLTMKPVCLLQRSLMLKAVKISLHIAFISHYVTLFFF